MIRGDAVVKRKDALVLIAVLTVAKRAAAGKIATAVGFSHIKNPNFCPVCPGL